MCLQCWQTGKEFRLHWHSFVRFQILYKYRLSINWRPNCKAFVAQCLAHSPLESGIVSSSPAIFFISLSFLFIFLNFEVKQCANIFWKYDNAGFAMEKKPNFFIFKMANTSHKGKTRHIALLSSFLFKVQCFNWDENDLAPDDKRKRRRSDPVLWQDPLYQQKISKTKGQYTNATKNFDYTTIAGRLRTVSWSNKSSNWCG